MSPAIEIANLTMIFRTNWGTRKKAIENLCLEVREREIFGFLGHNGAGKSTTIKILVGLCHCTKGTASILGEPISKKSARSHIGYLPENVSFYEYLTGLETVEFYGRLRGLNRQTTRMRAEKLMEDMGLDDAKNRRVSEYSKGMRQRLGLAQCMIHDPQVLILDEPLTGLDPAGRREIREKVRLFREQGKTVFFSSHVLADVEKLCDRVALLTRGRLIDVGNLDELLGENITSIEIVGIGFSERAIEKLNILCTRIFTENSRTVAWVENEDQAREVQKLLNDSGGELKALIPHRESLEDFYFRREQQEKESGGENSVHSA